ncbi:MATE family efflux transporter [Desulfotomaculum copahuensis]|uniref:MATE family efflux transporter n=2 Tax=Desulfotomaculum copahuensis TaxID=1838280 RepID=A0A1B7LFI0_9FIRM|nr:MATE family efflux transporter [Desulfotomaculum copahuensis]
MGYSRCKADQSRNIASKRQNRSMLRTLFIFLIPLLLSNALQSTSGTVGSIFIGRFIGVRALAALSSFFPLLFLLISFLIGLGSGSTVLIGQAYGAGRYDRMKAVVGTTLTATFVLGAVLAVLGGLFTTQVLRLMGTPADIEGMAAGFSRIMFWGLPIMFVYIVYTTFLRGSGDSKTPFYFLVVSTIISLLLYVLFIPGWFGLPRLGLNGAAYASILGPLSTLVLMLVYLHRTKHPLGLDREVRRHLGVDWGMLKTLVKIGVPTGIQMINVSLSEVAVVTLVNGFGSNATAAYGAYYQVANYVQMPAVSMGIAASVFGAQAIGAGRTGQIRDVIRDALKLNYVIGGLLMVFCYGFAREILSLFLTDPVPLDIAYRLLMITLWSYLILGNTQVLAGIMRAGGTVLGPTILSIVTIWGVEIPIAYVLSRHIGVDGIWVGYSASFVAGLCLQYLYYRLFWRQREHRALIS